MKVLMTIITLLIALSAISLVYNIINYVAIHKAKDVSRARNVIDIIFIILLYIVGIGLTLYIGYQLLLAYKYIPFREFM